MVYDVHRVHLLVEGRLLLLFSTANAEPCWQGITGLWTKLCWGGNAQSSQFNMDRWGGIYTCIYKPMELIGMPQLILRFLHIFNERMGTYGWSSVIPARDFSEGFQEDMAHSSWSTPCFVGLLITAVG